jgi:hypothetical protein
MSRIQALAPEASSTRACPAALPPSTHPLVSAALSLPLHSHDFRRPHLTPVILFGPGLCCCWYFWPLPSRSFTAHSRHLHIFRLLGSRPHSRPHAVIIDTAAILAAPLLAVPVFVTAHKTPALASPALNTPPAAIGPTHETQVRQPCTTNTSTPTCTTMLGGVPTSPPAPLPPTHWSTARVASSSREAQPHAQVRATPAAPSRPRSPPLPSLWLPCKLCVLCD